MARLSIDAKRPGPPGPTGKPSRALGRPEFASVKQALFELFEDPVPEVRRVAIEALSRFELDSAGREAIERMTRDPDTSVKTAARVVLKPPRARKA